jgi:hypothetical protein
MNKLGSLFEIIWFVLGGFLLFIAVEVTIEKGIENSWYYFIFAILSLLMYYRRRQIRISDK